MTSNLDRAEKLLEGLAALGVRACCVAPGGRNSPLVAALEAAEGFERYRFFDERSAAFFALGRARALAAPVAVITTSGTAAAELLPAAIEGRHAGVPLVLVTADRPERLRGTGAPQTIEQPGLFGEYAPTVLLEGARPDPRLVGLRRPIHVNVPFDDPLLDRRPAPRKYEAASVRPGSEYEGSREELEAFLAEARGLVVIVGTLDRDDVAPVREFLTRLGAPVYAEGHSGLREDPELAPFLVRSDSLLTRRAPPAVLRIGGVPTARFWRDLEGATSAVFSIAGTPFAGLSRGALIHGPIGEVLGGFTPPRIDVDLEAHRRADRHWIDEVERLLTTEPTSEPALVRRLSARLPLEARLYLGNSLPIREWDLFAATTANRRSVFTNRGANGIDGQVSTFLGLLDDAVENWALIGDLTLLYDLSAPWVLPQLGNRRLRLVVINNRGGRIFERLFDDPVFVNEHAIPFEPWARMWDLRYECWDDLPDRLPDADRSVIELRPDPEATRRFWRRYEEIGSAP